MKNSKKLTNEELNTFRAFIFQNKKEQYSGATDAYSILDENISVRESDSNSEQETDRFLESENGKMAQSIYKLQSCPKSFGENISLF